MTFNYSILTEQEKAEYNKTAQQLFGKTFVFSSTGEPLYFTKQFNLNPIHQIVLDNIAIMKNKS